jgi:4-amino-4-deoxy-L-arabinose transferase-like glycosyltransferase
MIEAGAGAEADSTLRAQPPHDRRPRAEERFVVLLVAIIVLGATIRLGYVLTDHRVGVGGDGFFYSIDGRRLGDGLGYTSYTGAQNAHHPPGWVTALGLLAWFGGRSLLAQQLLGVAIGLGVIAVTALVGRRYFNPRVGLLAAAIAALYPGFWVFEAQVLAEPLGLLVLGFFMLAVIVLRDRPTLGWSVIVGVISGLLALVRSEHLALLVVVVAPVLFRATSIAPFQRVRLFAIATAATILVIAPWALYNETRFNETVVLSTNGGSTLLAGNCPPSTYHGERLGYYDISCNRGLGFRHRGQGLDGSDVDLLARRAALTNIGDNLERLPVVIPARFGRALAVFRPTQTVALTADWFASPTWPVWAWVVSFWLLIPLTVLGVVEARRSGGFLLPLLAPGLVAMLLVAVTYGEPRYHTPADLGFIVLAAVAVNRLTSRDRTT